jgi:transcription-repair coupling factor (superfamily II helicase)
MHELKESEFKELFSDDNVESADNIRYVTDCNIDTDLEIHIPDNYVENMAERIRLYREIDNIQDIETLDKFKSELSDRFGKIPDSAEAMFEVVKLRWIAIDLGFEKIILRNNKLIIHFVSNQLSPYYQSPVFSNILKFVQRKPQLFRMKEGTNRLTLSIDNIKSISDCHKLFNQMLPQNNLDEPGN